MNISLAKVAGLAIGGFVSLAATLAPAHAAVYDWTLYDTSSAAQGGLAYTGSGTLTVSDTPVASPYNATAYEVTGITGTLNGLTITGLLAAGTYVGNDNLVFPAALSVLDGSGFAFETASGLKAGIWGFNSPDVDGSIFVPTNNNYAEYINGGFDGVGHFTLTAAPVPEPASLALLGAGLFGLGFVRRRRA